MSVVTTAGAKSTHRMIERNPDLRSEWTISEISTIPSTAYIGMSDARMIHHRFAGAMCGVWDAQAASVQMPMQASAPTSAIDHAAPAPDHARAE